MDAREFTTTDITKIFGISRMLLKDWMMNDYVRPSIQVARGKGSKHLFSLYDLYAIALFQRLINAGFKREWASHYSEIFYRTIKTLTNFGLTEEGMKRLKHIVFPHGDGLPRKESREGTIVMDKETIDDAAKLIMSRVDCDMLYVIDVHKLINSVNEKI